MDADLPDEEAALVVDERKASIGLFSRPVVNMLAMYLQYL